MVFETASMEDEQRHQIGLDQQAEVWMVGMALSQLSG